MFWSGRDRLLFPDTLGEACRKTGWQVHALCLMPNHFPLVIETLGGNLVAGMKRFLGTHTSPFNRRHKLFGHLFSGRYKALMLAKRLRRETTMTLRWITERLNMGTAGSLANLSRNSRTKR